MNEIREEISGKLEGRGFPTSMETAIYEALKNAHEHGNGRNPEKLVKMGTDFEGDAAEVVVIDEGGMIDPLMVPFIISYRTGENKGTVVDFYEFSKRKRHHSNLGMGTGFIHQYSDEVKYFKDSGGGLALYMLRNK